MTWKKFSCFDIILEEGLVILEKPGKFWVILATVTNLESLGSCAAHGASKSGNVDKVGKVLLKKLASGRLDLFLDSGLVHDFDKKLRINMPSYPDPAAVQK